MDLRRFEPAVSKHMLVLISGILWGGAGILLSIYATGWLIDNFKITVLMLIIPAVIAVIIIYRYCFRRIVIKNIDRIGELKERICVFAFQAWRSYPIILIMMSLGIILRHSPIPKIYLIVPYYAIGIALFIGGINYFNRYLLGI